MIIKVKENVLGSWSLFVLIFYHSTIMHKLNTAAVLAHILLTLKRRHTLLSSLKRLPNFFFFYFSCRMGQRISLGVCVLRHLINLICTGVNQLVQFPFCLNENVHLTRHYVTLTPSVHRRQNTKEQISSANLGFDFKLGRLIKNR